MGNMPSAYYAERTMRNATYAERAKKYLIKTVQYDRVKDKRIIDWFESVKDASDAIRMALNFYLDYRDQLLDINNLATPAPVSVDAEAITQAVAQALLPQVREIVEAALETALAGAVLAPAAPREAEARPSDLAGQIDLDMVLE